MPFAGQNHLFHHNFPKHETYTKCDNLKINFWRWLELKHGLLDIHVTKRSLNEMLDFVEEHLYIFVTTLHYSVV